MMGKKHKHNLGGSSFGVIHDLTRYVLEQLPLFLYIQLLIKGKTMKNYIAHFWKPAVVRSGGVGFTTLSTSRGGLFLF